MVEKYYAVYIGSKKNPIGTLTELTIPALEEIGKLLEEKPRVREVCFEDYHAIRTSITRRSLSSAIEHMMSR